jgi:hypothetical protein
MLEKKTIGIHEFITVFSFSSGTDLVRIRTIFVVDDVVVVDVDVVGIGITEIRSR